MRPASDLVRRRLRRWYGRHRRDLPWRRTRDPYKIWISEVLLQQTQVATALPYYQRFLRRFPTVGVLAASPLEAVLQAWSGLGYYRRARYLHAAAARIVEQHRGEFPRSWEQARALPGVGEYTAAAVLSIAYGAALALVDGNVQRVLARLCAVRQVLGARERRALRSLAQELLDPSDPGGWNQALMELGALVCLPASPRCDVCPLRALCGARAAGNPERYPRLPPRRGSEKVRVGVALVERGAALLWHRRSDQAELLAGMWELPHARLAWRADDGHEDIRGALALALRQRYRLRLDLGDPVATARHAITFRRLSLIGYRAHLQPGCRPRGPQWRWRSPAQARRLAHSSVWAKLLG
jgi:A/G-specific adenine glycosylase